MLHILPRSYPRQPRDTRHSATGRTGEGWENLERESPREGLFTTTTGETNIASCLSVGTCLLEPAFCKIQVVKYLMEEAAVNSRTWSKYVQNLAVKYVLLEPLARVITTGGGTPPMDKTAHFISGRVPYITRQRLSHRGHYYCVLVSLSFPRARYNDHHQQVSCTVATSYGHSQKNLI